MMMSKHALLVAKRETHVPLDLSQALQVNEQSE